MLEVNAERPALSKFEGRVVGYILNQAGMVFFRVGSYPHYTIEDGRMVEDKSQESKDLKTRCREAKQAIETIKDKLRRGVRVPNTLMKRVEEEKTLVMALEETKMVHKEWTDHYFQALRFFEAYREHQSQPA